MISSTEQAARARLGATLVLLLALSGCTPEQLGPRNPVPAPGARVGLELSSVALTPGDTVQVRLVAEAGTPGALASQLGKVFYDPRTLHFVGQPLEGDALILVNTAWEAAGELRVISVRVPGLPRVTADLRFEVLRSGYADALRYELEEAVTANLDVAYHAERLPLSITGTSPDSLTRPIRRLALEDWWRQLGLIERARTSVAGAGRVFGDVSLNGIVDGIDASVVANIAVGNRPLLVDASRDNAIAGDVAPFNLPGLGEAADAIPPGRNPDGSFTISGLDAVVIANEAVGNDQPVAGLPIPGRQPRPYRVVLAGGLISSRILTRDTIYELQGNVVVGPGATLTIQPGTLIEGDPATRGAIVVARAGNIDWQGTRLEPIIFTCAGAAKSPGCWGGVVLNGLALLNNRDPGTTGFCPEKVSVGSTELYGGCLVEDTTGVMRYVRIEYGGMRTGGPIAAPGLALLGIGTGTVIENVQVHGSLGDGVYLSGGNVNLRRLVLTGNLGASLHWDHGWGGNDFGGSAQFVQVQVPQGGGDAIVGSNLASAPNAGPRSQPDLYNVTVAGAGAGAGSGRGFVLQDGSAGTLRNAIILQTAGSGFDVQGPESCAQIGGGLAFLDHDIFFGNAPDFATDADCLDEAVYATSPALQNRVIAPGLIAPENTLTPDTRPFLSSAATAGAALPPSNLFFDLTADYLGAVAPVNSTGSNVPWYAGWSRGWSGSVP